MSEIVADLANVLALVCLTWSAVFLVIAIISEKLNKMLYIVSIILFGAYILLCACAFLL